MKKQIVVVAVLAAAFAANAEVPKGGYTGVNPGRAGKVRPTSTAAAVKDGASEYRMMPSEKLPEAHRPYAMNHVRKGEWTSNKKPDATQRMRYRANDQLAREPLQRAPERTGVPCRVTPYHRNCGGQFGAVQQTAYGPARKCAKCGKYCKDDKREVELRRDQR